MYIGPFYSHGRRAAKALEEWLRDVDHPIARALVRPRELRSGGLATRRDHALMLAGGTLLVAIVWTVAFATLEYTDTHPATGTTTTVLTGIGVFVLFGGAYAAWQTMKHIIPAVRRARPKIERGGSDTGR